VRAIQSMCWKQVNPTHSHRPNLLYSCSVHSRLFPSRPFSLSLSLPLSRRLITEGIARSSLAVESDVDLGGDPDTDTPRERGGWGVVLGVPEPGKRKAGTSLPYMSVADELVFSLQVLGCLCCRGWVFSIHSYCYTFPRSGTVGSGLIEERRCRDGDVVKIALVFDIEHMTILKSKYFGNGRKRLSTERMLIGGFLQEYGLSLLFWNFWKGWKDSRCPPKRSKCEHMHCPLITPKRTVLFRQVGMRHRTISDLVCTSFEIRAQVCQYESPILLTSVPRDDVP